MKKVINGLPACPLCQAPAGMTCRTLIDSRATQVIHKQRSRTPYGLPSEHAAPLLRQLKPRLAAVLIMRYGLDGLGARTFRVIGVAYGMTVAAARVFVLTALQNLRWDHYAPLLHELLLSELTCDHELHRAIAYPPPAKPRTALYFAGR